MKLNIVFMGTPNFAVPILEALIEEYNVVLVVSQPDKEYSRKKELLPTKTKMVAIKHNIDIFQPVKIKDEYQKILLVNRDQCYRISLEWSSYYIYIQTPNMFPCFITCEHRLRTRGERLQIHPLVL